MTTGKKFALAIVVLIVLLAGGLGALFYLRPFAVVNWLHRQSLARAGFTLTEVEANVGPQAVWENGHGPPLVFLHGLGDQAGTWYKVAPAFTDHYRVLALDLPGHGDSAPQEGPLPLSTVYRGIEAVLGQKVREEKMILVGNSLGAVMASKYALRHPGRVERVVLIGGGPLRRDLKVNLVPTTRDEARRLMAAVVHQGADQIPDFMLDALIRRTREGPIGRLRLGDEVPAYTLPEERLDEFTTPADLLWGESDGLVPVEYARRLEESLPAARLSVLAACGHVPQHECPQRFLNALRQALEQPAPERAPAPELER